MSDVVQLNVMVAERIYPLRVQENEREEMLEAVKLVNDKLKDYQRTYEGKDKQDYMAMVLLLLAIELVRSQRNKRHGQVSFDHTLTHLEQLLAASV